MLRINRKIINDSFGIEDKSCNEHEKQDKACKTEKSRDTFEALVEKGRSFEELVKALIEKIKRD